MHKLVNTCSLLIASSAMFYVQAEEAAKKASEVLAEQDKGDGGFFDAIFGPGMWPLWICSVLLIAFIFERHKGLKREKIIDRDMVDAFTKHVSRHDMDAAQSVAKASETVVGKAWAQGVEEFKFGGVSIQEALTDKSLLAFKPLKRNLQAIATLGVISPLLGLLGTVAGMIITFQQIAATGGADKTALAGGISLALLTTCGGLIVAIPAIVSGRFFNSRLIGLAEEVEDDIHRVSYRYNAYEASDDFKTAKETTKKQIDAVAAGAGETA